MKRIFTVMIIVCLGVLTSSAFGQQDKNTKDKKGGFSVGGYDNTRQEKETTVTKRSVVISDEAAPEQKAMEVEEAPKPAPVAAPAPAQAPPAADKQQKENQGNAYGKNKEGQEGKDFGQARSGDAKEKQKAKKNKTKRR